MADHTTAIIVAGSTAGLPEEYRSIGYALGLIDPKAERVVMADWHVFAEDDVAPIKEEQFRSIVADSIDSHGEKGLLFFMQFGHGAEGPGLILADEKIYREELVKLFSDNIVKEPTKKPYTAIIMGGCYSGGFGKFFLENPDFVPDFFFGASPPFSVNHTGLEVFINATKSTADYNKDGVLTLRERAVYQMNNSKSPFAIMYMSEGSRDIDMEGNLAKAPYFEKKVVEVADDRELTQLLKIDQPLRFGEAAVILVKGNDADVDSKLEWFKKQAEEGDGFYKFVVVENNDATHFRFSASDITYSIGETSLIAYGPNITGCGVKLSFDRPIGYQMPRVIASQDPIDVIDSSHYMSRLDLETIRVVRSSAIFDPNRELSKKLEELISASSTEDQLSILESIVQSLELYLVKSSYNTEAGYLYSNLLTSPNVEVRRKTAQILRHIPHTPNIEKLKERFTIETDEDTLLFIIGIILKISDLKSIRSLKPELQKAGAKVATDKLKTAFEECLSKFEEFEEKEARQTQRLLMWQFSFGALVAAFARHDTDYVVGGPYLGAEGEILKGLAADDAEENVFLLGLQTKIAPLELQINSGISYSFVADVGLTFRWQKVRFVTDFGKQLSLTLGYSVVTDYQTIDHGPTISLEFLFDSDNEVAFGPAFSATCLLNGEFIYTLGLRTVYRSLRF